MINMALNVNPKMRYQSVDDMRHALERQTLLVDWSESTFPTSVVWHGIDACGNCYEVAKTQQNDKKWKIETRRGSSATKLRHIHKLCSKDMRKDDADKQARRILQAYVIGKT